MIVGGMIITMCDLRGQPNVIINIMIINMYDNNTIL